MSDLYDTDILLWSERQAELLRRRAAGRLVNDADLDWSALAEEIEDVGINRLHAVETLLVQALRNMLKAQAWPLFINAPSWRADAVGFRLQARRRFVPSMGKRIDIADLYADALFALPETVGGQSPLPLPLECTMTLNQLLSGHAVAAGGRTNEAELDWPNIIEEIESVGRDQLLDVRTLLVRVLVHMLKAQAWPLSRDVPHWVSEAKAARIDALDGVTASMRERIDLADLYRRALHILPETIDGQPALPLSDICPVSLDDLLGDSATIAGASQNPNPHPHARVPNQSGAFGIKAGGRFVYDIDGRHGWVDEFLHGGDAFVTFDDGTHDTIKWSRMSPECR